MAIICDMVGFNEHVLQWTLGHVHVVVITSSGLSFCTGVELLTLVDKKRDNACDATAERIK